MSSSGPSEHILIIADIHGNWPALDAVLTAERLATRILCLGDLVHYGPDCARVVSWAKFHLGAGDLVQGNHDEAAAKGKPTVPQGWRETLPTEIATRTHRMLSSEGKEFLRRLPSRSRLPFGAGHWYLVHGLPGDPLHGYLLADGNTARWEAEVRTAGQPDALLLGHTHRPFLKTVLNTTVLNPGSVGRPKDGDPRASYAVWSEGVFTLKRVDYDQTDLFHRVERAFSHSLAQKLTQELAGGNTSGHPLV
jgi:predicted phosphodiesterase